MIKKKKELPPAQFNKGDIVFVVSPVNGSEFYGCVTEVLEETLEAYASEVALEKTSDDPWFTSLSELYDGEYPRAYQVEFAENGLLYYKIVGEDWLELVESAASARVSMKEAVKIKEAAEQNQTIASADCFVNEDGHTVVEIIMYRGDKIEQIQKQQDIDVQV